MLVSGAHELASGQEESSWTDHDVHRNWTPATEKKSTLDFHSNGQIPPDDQHALLFIPSGAPTRQNSLRLQPRDAGRRCRSCQGATPGSSALGSVREPRPNGRPGRMTAYPSSSTPSMIDHIMPSQSAHFTVGTTRRQRMRCLSSLAWPPLL